MKIYYDNRTDEKVTDLKPLLRKALNEVLKEEKCNKDIELSISFVTDEEIKELNKMHRNKNKATDVLSFPMLEYNEGEFFKDLSSVRIEEERDMTTCFVNLGDIVVSLETIKRQAKEFHTTFKKELCLMVIHSMLHLMGYDHIKKCDEKIMFSKQEEILSKVKFK